MRSMYKILIIIIVITTISCKDKVVESTLQKTDDFAIRETVLYNMFTRFQTNCYFIAFVTPDSDSIDIFGNRMDPPDSFLSLFRNYPVPIKSYSDMEYRNYGYYDITSGLRGILLDVWSPIYISQDKASIECSYFYGLKSNGGLIYFLTKQQYNWVIDSIKIRWIS